MPVSNHQVLCSDDVKCSATCRVEIAIQRMKKHIHRDISLVNLAHSVGLSSSRFRQLFRTKTGLSPIRYFQIYRMELARELLETTQLSILEIMLRVGVNDRSHFERRFKRVYGITPSRYRTWHIRRALANLTIDSRASVGETATQQAETPYRG